MESASSWGPQANSQPEPPMAHAPKPNGGILMSGVPSGPGSIRILCTGGPSGRFGCANIFIFFHWRWVNRVRKKLEESRKIKGESPQFTVIAASSETDSPSGFVMVSCREPAARLGVTTVSVFMSLKDMVAAFPLMETVVAL